jgi:TfoX/Sxy family transcriptional regulator of competence genes
MFGNHSAFLADGAMFAGVFGDTIFVRLPEAERAVLLEQGASPFGPMPERPMKEYLTAPQTWREQPGLAREWLARSLEWAVSLPPKPAPSKTKRRQPGREGQAA